MKTYKTVNDYLQNYKIGDRIVLGGRGAMNGLKVLRNKYDTYKVVDGTTIKELKFTAYRGRRTLSTKYYDQELAVLTATEFNNLKA